MFLQVDVSESGLLLIQRSNADCNVSVCDRESSIVSKPWPMEAKIIIRVISILDKGEINENFPGVCRR